MKSSLVLFVGLLSSMIVNAAENKEPVVDGKPVSFWVGMFSGHADIRKAAEWTANVREEFSKNGNGFAPYVLTYATTNQDGTIDFEDSQNAANAAFHVTGELTRTECREIIRTAFKDPRPHVRCNALNASTFLDNGFTPVELINLHSEFDADPSPEVRKIMGEITSRWINNVHQPRKRKWAGASVETPANQSQTR